MANAFRLLSIATTLAALAAIAPACKEQETDTDTDTDADSDTDGYSVDVTADANTAAVDLSTLTTVDVGGDQVVPLTAVLEASALSVTWADRTYDFVASDGFRPSQQKGCDPLDYTTIEGGYLYPETGNLTWDEALKLRGCYFVDGVVTVDVQAVAR